MGMLQDYKDQEENRQKVAKQTWEFYQTVDLPGTRTFDYAVRQHIKEMAEVKALPNHD